MRRALALLLMVAAGPALADVITVTWTNPTAYVDGTALPASSLVGTRIEYGTCSSGAFGTKAGEWLAPAGVTQSDSPNLAAGSWCIRAFARAAVTASCPTPCESLASNVAAKTFMTSPGAPTGLTVKTVQIAYTIETTEGALSTLAIGTVKAGAQCHSDWTVNNLSRVDVADVDLLPGQSALVAFAKCG